ncbi:phage portal protein [Kibdelosporangium aridum]|uniref:Phage portal protein n=1 Tax=Kibdelosporangium aridum TaxID=2030 RepID=A0A428YUR4_KIBAR|nr:phage portal protein [Kibdelosporangium aridum]RSM73460.1 phage portal protein [Kibdelosporangium aridum]
MPVTLAQATEMTEKLAKVIKRRQPEVEQNRDYYEGEQKLRFSSPQYRDYFADRYEKFSDNWVGIVADSPTERLDPIGIRLAGEEEVDKDLWNVWLANDADAEVGLAMLDAITCRRSFAFVWGNDDDPEKPFITFESATEAAVAYEPGSRTKRKAYLKTFVDDDVERASLYTHDEVWRFHRAATRRGSKLIVVGDIGVGGWQLTEDGEPNPKPNPLGVPPGVELPNRPLLARDPISDVTGVMAMQDAINLLWSQLFVAADFASFPQRVILGMERPMLPILNENGEKVGEQPIDLRKFAVDRVVWLEDPSAKVDQWEAARLDVYTDVVEVAVGHVAAQTRTPQHYLIGKMANLSAEALVAAETGLVKRTEEKQLYFGRAIREVFRLVALAQGNKSKAGAIATGAVRWKDAQSRSEAQLVDALVKLQTLGFPFEWLAERLGLTPPEIDRVMAMRDKASEAVLGNPAALIGAKLGQEDVDADRAGGAGQPALPLVGAAGSANGRADN